MRKSQVQILSLRLTLFQQVVHLLSEVLDSESFGWLEISRDRGCHLLPGTGGSSSANGFSYNGVAKENWQPGCKQAVQTAGGHWLNSSMEAGEIGVSANRCLHRTPLRDRGPSAPTLRGGSSIGRAPDSTRQPCGSLGS